MALDWENLNNEQELLSLVAEGDEQAYQQIFDRYWDRVYGTALRLTKSPEQAKDLAQDIFLKLWDNRARLRGVRRFTAYLYVITKNLVHDQIRTKTFQESNRQFLIEYFSYDEHSPHELLERKELGDAIQNILKTLPPKLRQVFTLSRFEGLSHEEIAQRMNITPLSSKTYMVRALQAFRKQMEKNAGKLIFIGGLVLNIFTL